jgi:hypothetical protein
MKYILQLQRRAWVALTTLVLMAVSVALLTIR